MGGASFIVLTLENSICWHNSCLLKCFQRRCIFKFPLDHSFSKRNVHMNNLEILLKCRSGFSKSGTGPEILNSNKLSGDADAVSPWTAL